MENKATIKKVRSKVGIFGVAGYNRGDDAIAISVVAGLRRAGLNCDFIIPTLRRSVDFADLETFVLNRRTVSGITRLIAAIWHCDVILLGGGSLIQDKLGGSRTRGVIGYAWTITLIAKYLGKPILTIPLGVDELETDLGRRASREIFRRLQRLTVRDRLSADNVIEILGENSSSSHLVRSYDPAFWYPHNIKSRTREKEPHYVLCPAFEGLEEHHISLIFASVATALLKSNPKARITLVAMDERIHEDGAKISLIQAVMPQELRDRISSLVPKTVDETVEVLATASGVVAMRLHAIILSYGKVPVFCVSRTTKTDALIEELGVAGLRLSRAHDADAVGALALAAMHDKDALSCHSSKLLTIRDELDCYFSDTCSEIRSLIAAS